MRVKIWRGSREIGGSCIEVEASGSRLVLDVGKPLDVGWNEDVVLPRIRGLQNGDDRRLAGVIVSHPHLDHYGLLSQVHPRVPIFAGADASRVVEAASFFSPLTTGLHVSRALQHRTPMSLGAFTVTPYLNDHSAFDAYSLLLEAGGRRLFYTGDIRGHGRKAKLFEQLLADPPRGIDVMLMEGTHVRDVDDDTAPRTEDDLELSLAKRMRDTPGAVAVVSSPQNLDRLVTIYRACRRAGRTLVVDLYSSAVAQAARPTIPQPGFPGLRVWLPQRQRVLVKTSGEFSRAARVRAWRMFPDEFVDRADELVVLTPSSGLTELVRVGALAGGVAVWSMWPGYLRDAERLRTTLSAASVPLVVDHVSGHAPVRDLRRLVDALRPTCVVPVHTEHPERYCDLFGNAEMHSDGEWWAA